MLKIGWDTTSVGSAVDRGSAAMAIKPRQSYLRESVFWPIASFVPFCAWRLLVEGGKRYLGGPASRSISRPTDRSTEPANGLGPFGSRFAPPRTPATTRYARFQDANNQDWSRVSPACCVSRLRGKCRLWSHHGKCGAGSFCQLDLCVFCIAAR